MRKGVLQPALAIEKFNRRHPRPVALSLPQRNRNPLKWTSMRRKCLSLIKIRRETVFSRLGFAAAFPIFGRKRVTEIARLTRMRPKRFA
jgi:hypothetical protein